MEYNKQQMHDMLQNQISGEMINIFMATSAVTNRLESLLQMQILLDSPTPPRAFFRIGHDLRLEWNNEYWVVVLTMGTYSKSVLYHGKDYEAAAIIFEATKGAL